MEAEQDSPPEATPPKNNRLLTQFMIPRKDIQDHVIRKHKMLEEKKMEARGRLGVLLEMEKQTARLNEEKRRLIEIERDEVEKLPKEIDRIKNYALQAVRYIRMLQSSQRRRAITGRKQSLRFSLFQSSRLYNFDGEEIEKLAHQIQVLTKCLDKEGNPLLLSLIEEKKEELKIMQRKRVAFSAEEFLLKEEEDCMAMVAGWPLWGDLYQPLQLIGKGGSSQVYKCFSLKSMTFQAIKLHYYNETWSQQQRNTFMKHIEREYDTHNKLQHPNILGIKALLVEQEKTFLVMELCDGPDLALYLKQRGGSVSESIAVEIARQIVSALLYLASRNPIVIHYDLKPQNIIFHRGQVKLVDFGLCKLIDPKITRMELTSPGHGTFLYLPPECFNAENPNISSKVDVWSLGIILFQMVSGQKPFRQGPIPPRKQLQEQCPTSQCYKQLVSNCLEGQVDQRWSIQQVDEFLSSHFK